MLFGDHAWLPSLAIIYLLFSPILASDSPGTTSQAGSLQAANSSPCNGLNYLQNSPRKWKSYEFVLGNCLVKRFLTTAIKIRRQRHRDGQAANEPGEPRTVDFYLLLVTIESAAARNLNLIRLNHDQELASLATDKEMTNNKIRYELKFKASTRQAKHDSRVIENLLDLARVRAALQESRINELMDECTVSVIDSFVASSAIVPEVATAGIAKNSTSESGLKFESGDSNETGLQTRCRKMFERTLMEVEDLCRDLSAQLMLLDIANLNLSTRSSTKNNQ